MGRGTSETKPASADILFGDLRRTTVGAETEGEQYWHFLGLSLTPDNTFISRKWFQNYRGWSGTQQWMGKTSALPEKLVKGQEGSFGEGNTMMEIDQLINYTNLTSFVREGHPCQLLPRDEEEYLTIKLEEPAPSIGEAVVHIPSILAVEVSVGSSAHEWKALLYDKRLLYVAGSRRDMEVVGMVQTGYLS